MTMLLILGGVLLVGVLVLYLTVVRCANCWNVHQDFFKQFKRKSDAHVHRQDNGYQDGWRTVSENVETNTQYYDNGGHRLGTSKGFTQVNRTVPTRTYFYTDFYQCPDCGYSWSRNRQHRFDL